MNTFEMRVTFNGIVNVHFEDEDAGNSGRFAKTTARMIDTTDAAWNLHRHMPMLTFLARDLLRGSVLGNHHHSISASGTEIVTVPLGHSTVSFEAGQAAHLNRYSTRVNGPGSIDKVIDIRHFGLTAPTHANTTCTIEDLPFGEFSSGELVRSTLGDQDPLVMDFKPRGLPNPPPLPNPHQQTASNDLILKSTINRNRPGGAPGMVVQVGDTHRLVLRPEAGYSTLHLALSNLPHDIDFDQVWNDANNVEHLRWWAKWAGNPEAFRQAILLPNPAPAGASIQGKICPATRQVG